MSRPHRRLRALFGRSTGGMVPRGRAVHPVSDRFALWVVVAPVHRQDIEIPEPCHADWDAMRPEDKGRFCSECSKTVHDLSAMTKVEAKGFLRRTGCRDICVSFQHREDGTLVFREPVLRPEAVVPLARLRRPRSVAAAVAGAGMAVALAACAPHGEAPAQHYAAEAPVFEAPRVIVPHGSQQTGPVPPPVEHVNVEEPCEPVVTEVEPAGSERIRGRMKPTPEPTIKRTAGKPMPMRVKGDLTSVDPDAL
jgi:hypothetical protein